MRFFAFRTTPPYHGLSLVDGLQKFMTEKLQQEASKSEIKRYMNEGYVFLNGKMCRRASKVLRSKVKIEFFLPTTDQLTAPDDIKVVAETDHWMVVDKPAGLSTQSTKQFHEPNLYDWLRFNERLETEPTAPYLGLLHRLDRPTSGLVIFSRRKSMNKTLAEAFTERLAKKTYVTVVCSPVWDTKTKDVVAALKRKTSGEKGYKSEVVPQGGQSAQTRFTWIKELSPGYQLVEAQPFTGRMHQIRAHLSHINAPILGDTKYGGERSDRLYLHHSRLQIPGPRGGIDVTSLPDFYEDTDR